MFWNYCNNMENNKKPSRRNERSQAFQVLYGLAFSPAATREDLAGAFAAAPEQEDDRMQSGRQGGFAWELVEGVWEKGADLDALLGRFSQNWRVERMGKVEATILRLALFELLFRPDVPPKVAINEAIELSKQFGGHDSRSFINGILDAAAKALDNGEIHRIRGL